MYVYSYINLNFIFNALVHIIETIDQIGIKLQKEFRLIEPELMSS